MPHEVDKEALVKTFDNMNTNADFDTDSRSCAFFFSKSLRNSEFIVTAVLLNNILTVIQPLSVKLQGRTMDVLKANLLVSDVINHLKQFGDATFSNWFDDSVLPLADSVDEQITRPRTASKRQHRANVPFETAKDYYRVAILRPFLDHIFQELDSRLTESRHIVVLLCKLCPQTNLTTSELSQLQTFYYDDLPSPSQLRV